MSTEGLWAVVFGFLILGEKMTGRELIGCGFMLIAVIISQLPVPVKKKGVTPFKRQHHISTVISFSSSIPISATRISPQ